MTNKAKKQLSDACGWYGMAAILIAFTCVSFQILSPTSPLYVTLSLTGAVGLVIETKSKSADKRFKIADKPLVSTNFNRSKKTLEMNHLRVV